MTWVCKNRLILGPTSQGSAYRALVGRGEKKEQNRGGGVEIERQRGSKGGRYR